MADLQLAAAYAAGGEPPAQSFAPGRAQPPAAVPMEYKVEEGLPNVDDLEVAAAAAGVAPVPAALAELGYFELGPVPAPMKQGSESSSSGSSSEEESSSSSDEGADPRPACPPAHPFVHPGTRPLLACPLVASTARCVLGCAVLELYCPAAHLTSVMLLWHAPSYTLACRERQRCR